MKAIAVVAMAVILLQGRAIPFPAISSSSGNLSSSLVEAQLLWHKRRNCSKLCRAAALPQRPFGEQHHKSSRQDVGGRALDVSKDPIPLIRSTSSSALNILSPAPPISFLSQELQDDALLLDDEEALRRTYFPMVLAICSALQLLYITDAVRLWVARLRLRYFDSPFTRSNVATKLGRIGIFWDIENCPIPGGFDAQMVVKQMQRVGASFGTIQCLRAYGKLEYLTRQVSHLFQVRFLENYDFNLVTDSVIISIIINNLGGVKLFNYRDLGSTSYALLIWLT